MKQSKEKIKGKKFKEVGKIGKNQRKNIRKKRLENDEKKPKRNKEKRGENWQKIRKSMNISKEIINEKNN